MITTRQEKLRTDAHRRAGVKPLTAAQKELLIQMYTIQERNAALAKASGRVRLAKVMRVPATF